MFDYELAAAERFTQQASHAHITPDQVGQVLRGGPGTVIAYDRDRQEYTVLDPDHHGVCEEQRFIAVWGHSDLTEELRLLRTDATGMDQCVKALERTALNGLSDWFLQGGMPACIADTRLELYRHGFAFDRHSHRWDGGIRDHLVLVARPWWHLDVKYADRPGALTVRVRAHLRDLGAHVQAWTGESGYAAAGEAAADFTRTLARYLDE
ncbi:hypothetical protein [Nocardiopsis chromatogenes]|uniref:hypothetical protein n=1 Tax=Nocardiopsis chromatogenes TaxID=280239 RepID=UPI0003495291|nr:hypothetical protein [Nocardiopsis chromatogenes]